MIKKYIFTAILTAIAVFTIYLWWNNYLFPQRCNYRITVNVETPDGVVSGSAVRQMVVNKSWISKYLLYFMPGSYTNGDTRGEAVIIDLGEDRGKIFALIDGGSYRELGWAFGVQGGLFKRNLSATFKIGEKRELEEIHVWPKMVTFTDHDDPKSVKLVYQTLDDPEDPRGNRQIRHDNAAKIFGEGYRIKDIWIEITDDPITWGRVQKELPQFNKEFQKWKRNFLYGDYRKINFYDFKRGEEE